MMDHGACNVIYLDRRAQQELVRKDTVTASLNARAVAPSPGYFGFGKPSPAEIRSNIETLLLVFSEVQVCRSGSACLDKIAQLAQSSTIENTPIIVLIDIPYDEEQRMKRLSREPRTPSPTAFRTAGTETPEPEDLYGMHLLRHISAEVQDRRLPRLVIPIVILTGLGAQWSGSDTPGTQVLTDTVRLVRYLDAGAVDVLASPISKDHIHGLAVHGYRVAKEVTREQSSFLKSTKARKVSWVGVDEAKPYAYLREAMVSGLMGNICCPDTALDMIDPNDVEVSPDRRAFVAQAVGTWAFSAHDLTDDELLYGALIMLQHALTMPEVERWRMNQDELTIFLLASRAAYNDFVLYHNFRHVVDVLQALFYFLVRIGALPSYPLTDCPPVASKPPIATLLKPFDALCLLVSAIGHDVGHPGVNNAFLVALNAPLAQLYNDRSVLESFHCAAYSQILRRYWPGAFEDVCMRKLMITSILATDMGLHFKYMADMGNLQEKLAHNRGTIDGWSPKVLEEYRDLLCGLLIKCADISNVARKFHTAAHWAAILTDEFSNQGQMEHELQIPTCLFGGPPVRDDLIKMGESQIGFMNIFARPLFESMSDIFPAMTFSVEELIMNKTVWQEKIEAEKALMLTEADPNLANLDAARSPMTTSQVEMLKARPKHPLRTNSEYSPSRAAQPSRIALPDRSTGTTPDASTRRSSVANAIPSPRFGENQSNSDPQSRRGSADASLTTILVTRKSKAADKKSLGSRLRSLSPAKRAQKQPKSRPDSPVRPLLAPFHDSATNLSFFAGGSVQSQTDFVIQPPLPLAHGANGGLHPHKHLNPHSGSHSPISVDSDYVRKPHTADGSGSSFPPPDPQPRRKRAGSSGNIWHRRKTLESSGSDGRFEPAETDQEKAGYLTAVMTSANTAQNAAPEPEQRPRRGFGFSRLWRRKNKSDREKEPPVPPPVPPKTPRNNSVVGVGIPGAYPETPPPLSSS